MENSSIETGATGEKSQADQISELRRTILALKNEIAARDAAEREWKRTVCELERSNRELQEFAFVASHDLQAPLRKTRTFADLLEEEWGPAMNEECRGYLRRMRETVGRMQNLLDGLLQYSRLSNGKFQMQQVDLKEVVQEVVFDMESYILQENGRVQMDVDTVIEGDPVQMRRVFQNLIHNAIKFRGDDAPIVSISGEVQEDSIGSNGEKAMEMVEIRVEDNGIGFDEADMALVFAPFQRLHPVHEYEGTGMGLPICERIVNLHNGELTARSEPGKGSVFILRLPVKQPDGQDAQQYNGEFVGWAESNKHQG